MAISYNKLWKLLIDRKMSKPRLGVWNMKRIPVRILLIIFLSACIFPWPVLANATPTDYIWEEGEIQGLVPMKSDNIVVDKETLIYHIQADPAGFYADVQVTYLLRNTSLTSQLLFGLYHNKS